jgi:nicotinamide-nucleotide amidase
MWADHVLPRLAARGVGADLEVRTLRLHGIGESQVAEVLGEPLLRATNPVVATYARSEAVDVRISAREGALGTAAALADGAEAAVVAALGGYVWARGTTSWAQAIDEVLAARRWTLATAERGTGGALVALLRGMAARRHAEVDGREDDGESRATGGAAGSATPVDREVAADRARMEAERLRAAAGTDAALALETIPRTHDLTAVIAVTTPDGTKVEERSVFQRGGMGADRAAIAAAAVLLATLRTD